MKFWILWSVDALVGVVVLWFFFVGLADGSVSSFNIALWLGILAALAGILGGSIWLRSIGQLLLGVIVLLILAIPAALAGFLMLLLLTHKGTWN